MHPLLIGLGALVFALLSLYFATLTYALRDFSRPRLADYLARHNKSQWLAPLVDYAAELSFVTAVGRLLANILILVFVLRLFHRAGWNIFLEYTLSVLVTIAITLVCSAALPQAIARHVGEELIGLFASWLHGLRLALLPITKVLHATDSLVAKAAGAASSTPPSESAASAIEQEIMSVVEEGEKDGVVGQDESAMISSVIEFHNTQVGQIMAARPEIVALEMGATLSQVKAILEESGHSRIPVYEGNLDHIVGVLYARDLLQHLGEPPDAFDVRSATRPPFFVPETKPLRDLLKDFRLQKVHMAIVLDEYGGTAGLVTIEDIFEELVGDISDEHEPQELAMLRKINDASWEADGRVYLDELNRVVGLNLPEDEGYDTLGGFLSTTLGRIPEENETISHGEARYIILNAEPQKVNRVRIELILQPARDITETTAP